MVAMVTPANADTEECDNYAYFEDLLTTRPEAAQDALPVRPAGPVKVPAQQNVDVYDVIADLTDRAGALCMEDVMNGAADSGSFPAASAFFAVLEIAYDYTGQHCNQGENVGVGGHFDTAVDTTTGAMLWSWGTTEYTGTAHSDISAAATAYYSAGLFVDSVGGKAFLYSQAVDYAGVSDFYCVGYFDWFFGDYTTINFPYATGAIA